MRSKEAKGKTPAAGPSQIAANTNSQSPKALEAAHHARFDQIIAPVKGYSLSDADTKNIREAILAIAAKKHSKAAALESKVTDPIGRKLIDWYRLQRGQLSGWFSLLCHTCSHLLHSNCFIIIISRRYT